MIIKDLYLDHFGKFRDREIRLGRGINVIYGGNESGKSTIFGFIRCMLFGAERARGRGAGKDIYSRFLPWNNDGSYDGRMTFEHEGHDYRIVRNLHKDSTEFALYDETDGREVMLPDGAIYHLIDGLTEANFKNSIAAGQLALMPEQRFSDSLKSHLVGLSMTGSEGIDVAQVMAALKEERKKAAKAVSDEAYTALLRQEEALAEKAEKGSELVMRREALTERLRVRRAELEKLEAENARKLKDQREEKARAIRLIQENNDIVEQYRARKEELKELQSAGEDKAYRQKLKEDLRAYESRQAVLDDLEPRYEELSDKSEGAFVKTLILILPLIAVIILVFMMGDKMGLSQILKYVICAALALLTAFLAFTMFDRSVRRSRRVHQMRVDIEELENAQESFLDHYGVTEVTVLRERTAGAAGRQEAEDRLKREIAALGRRYRDIQEPLAPYLEKYGDSVSLEDEPDGEADEAIKDLKSRIAETENSLRELDLSLAQLEETKAALMGVRERKKAMEDSRKNSSEDIMAIDLAAGTLTELTADMNRSFGRDLNKNVSEMLALMTAGQHDRVMIDEDFRILVDDGRTPAAPDHFSAGTADQVYFAARVAAAQMIFGETMPLILDDSFALYDDERLENTLQLLARQEYFEQVILLTCHKREMEILERCHIPYHGCHL